MKNYVSYKEFANHTCYYDDEGYHHRLDGPALKYKSGSEIWKINGKFHRIKGPAYTDITYNYTHYGWHKNGHCHRLNAPAVYKINCIGMFDKQFWIFGERQK
jgi:hypothetical protein